MSDLQGDLQQSKWLEAICSKKVKPEEQIPNILRAVQSQPEAMKCYLEVCTAIESLSRERFKEAEINCRPFGSTAINLAFKESKVDVFLDFNALPEPPDKLLKTLSNIIKQYRQVFRDAQVESNSRLIHCVHNSGIECNIWLSNTLAVFNSELISFYLSLDKRVRPLMMILKLWLRKQKMTSPTSLTVYGLTILVIFYLQQREVSILPSVYHLQVMSISKDKMSGWDMSFARDKDLVTIGDSKSSVLDLLRGFFAFFGAFNFGLYVVCPFTGRSILKPYFSQPILLPAELNLYKINLQKNPSIRFDFFKCMCVQDFFKHDQNVTRNVGKKDWMKFQSCCGQAAQICQSEANNPQLFNMLFKPYVKAKELNKIVLYLGKDLLFDGSVGFNEVDLRNVWGSKILLALRDTLTKIMKCLVKETEEVSGVKYFDCQVDHLLLSARRREQARQNFDFPKDLMVIDKEEMISDYLCDTALRLEHKLGLKFAAEYSVKDHPTRAVIQLTSLEKDPTRQTMLKEVFSSLETFIPALVEMTFDFIFNNV